MIYLGIDCGTQSTKALALESDSGVVLAAASKSYEMLPGLPPRKGKGDRYIFVFERG